MKSKFISEETQALIFDLGGVLLDLSFERTYQAFSELSSRTVEEIRTFSREPFFQDYECGRLSDNDFRNFLRAGLGTQASDSKLDDAWNAMLLDIPRKRLSIVGSLSSRYKIFLLSNTNAIHAACFTEKVLQQTGLGIEDYFHSIYYSHLLYMRKPSPEIFEHVLAENKLVPACVLFFDDLPENLAGAQEAGISTFHVTDANELFEKLGAIE
jgi:glucose-1-phosphatase